MLPGRVFGPGGFPVIAGGAPKTYFAGTFTAGQTKIDIVNNKLRIQQDGSIVKFVESVFKIVFSGGQAIKYGKETVYITERAIFRLTNRGLVLEEVAPGIDIEGDITSKMGFQPIIGSVVREMDTKLFQEGQVGMRDEIIQIMKR